MEKNKPILVIILLLLVSATFALLIFNRLDFLRNTPQVVFDASSPESKEVDKFETYIEKNLERGYFVDYQLDTMEFSLMSENALKTETKTKSFKIDPQKEVLCWPNSVTVTNTDGSTTSAHFSTVYMQIQPGNILQYNQQRVTTLDNVLAQLNETNYIFIHHDDQGIREIAIAGCL